MRTAMTQAFERWLHRHPDDDVLRWLYGALLTAAVAVLALDYMEMSARGVDVPSIQSAPAPLPDAPSDNPLGPADGPRGKMTFELVGDGRLLATGTIAPGTAAAFAAEVDKRGVYVKTVVLHSPGGSVSDALAMGRLIRKRGFATEVQAICASSCPLVFAGGTERRAGAKASIGVHQVFGISASGASLGMDSGQRVSAECQKYLREMGVDLEVWVRAMETPKERLYTFKPDELLTLKLATQSGTAKPAAAVPAGAAPAGAEARAKS